MYIVKFEKPESYTLSLFIARYFKYLEERNICREAVDSPEYLPYKGATYKVGIDINNYQVAKDVGDLLTSFVNQYVANYVGNPDTVQWVTKKAAWVNEQFKYLENYAWWDVSTLFAVEDSILEIMHMLNFQYSDKVYLYNTIFYQFTQNLVIRETNNGTVDLAVYVSGLRWNDENMVNFVKSLPIDNIYTASIQEVYDNLISTTHKTYDRWS